MTLGQALGIVLALFVGYLLLSVVIPWLFAVHPWQP